MNPLFLIPVQVLACILLADFLTGLFHWMEDAYGSADWPVLGKHVIQPNLDHHRNPRAMTRNSYLRSADVPLILGGLYLAGAWILRALTWRTGLTVGLLVNAN